MTERIQIGNFPPKLYPCVPEYWINVPPFLRRLLGWLTIQIFTLSFASLPSCIIFLFPSLWRNAPLSMAIALSMVLCSMVLPSKEWPWMRKVGQLWYEIFQFSCNIPPELYEQLIEDGQTTQYIIAMHPHGIVPFQAILWTAYCEQYLSSKKTNKFLYGFGAAADIVMYLPFLRNLMGWLSAGPADYKTLKNGLVHGISTPVNAAGRKPKHLYILPGGIAEIFSSTPSKHAIIFKNRRGLVKLSIETGAKLIPTYVFGGTDFFNNLATSNGLFASLSRKLRMGVTIFWGHFGLPIPFSPRVSLCIGDPIDPPVWDKSKQESIPPEMIEELHQRFLKSMIDLFEKYKVEAGYPDAKLEIM
eukprot:gene7766-10551_t